MDTLPEEQPVLARLAQLGIAYERYEHPPIATGDDGLEHWSDIDAVHCKNLFLRNKKEEMWLVVALEDRRIARDDVDGHRPRRAGARHGRRRLRIGQGRPRLNRVPESYRT